MARIIRCPRPRFGIPLPPVLPCCRKNDTRKENLSMKKAVFVAIATRPVPCAVFALVDGFRKNEDKTAALIEAARDNDAFEARLLIWTGADANAKNEEDKTALAIAKEYDAPDVIALPEAAGIQ